MAKPLKIGGKTIPPLVVAGVSLGALYLFWRSWSKKAEKDINMFFYGQPTTPASSTITVPPGKKWLVNLRNGQTTTMTSTQLQKAIEAKGVKSYSEIKTRQA